MKQNPEHGEFPEKIWKSVEDKILDITEEITNSEDDKAAIARFKKPYKQLSDAERRLWKRTWTIDILLMQ